MKQVMAITVALTRDQLDTLYVALRVAQDDSKARAKKAQELLDFVEGKSPRSRHQRDYHTENAKKYGALAKDLAKLRAQYPAE